MASNGTPAPAAGDSKPAAGDSKPAAAAKPPVSEDVRRVFKAFDANGDGRISTSELGNVLKALGSTVSDEELKRVMVDLDTDKNGYVCIDEFNAIWVAGEGNTAEIKDAFDLYDQDHNGLISAEELHHVLNRLNMKCSVEDCHGMIKTVDADGDGNVNFEEFKVMMSNKAGGGCGDSVTNGAGA